MKTKTKIILIILGIVAVIYLGVYTVLTPFIRGVVVDEVTREPVENAWVMATAGIGTRTIAGDTGGTYAISRRHLRTGKNGVFYVFPRIYPSIPTPFTFGNMRKSLSITVRVMDGRRAEVNLAKDWWKRMLFVTIPVQYVERTNAQVNSELSGLSAYCTSGGYFFVQGNRAELCDAWELDYTIVQHQKYIQDIEKVGLEKKETDLWWARKNHAHLYMRNGEYKKALEIFTALKELDTKKGSKIWLFEYETKIKELKEKLKEK
jgi:hypothetical protein